MGIKVNLADVEGMDFEPLPAGNYHVRVTDGEIRESGENAKNPGSEYINWELTVASGDHEGRKLFFNTSLLPHALFGLKALIEYTSDHTGLDPDDEDLDFEIEDLVGAELGVRVGQRTYQGELRNEVKRPVSLDKVTGDESLMP